MVQPSAAFAPVLLKGMTVHPDDPLRLDFIVDGGESGLPVAEIKKESERLVKYFLASMTVPSGDFWVNLSPEEKDRIIPENLSRTQLGRDLLAQDYLLKQLTASLMYPEKELGQKFWKAVRARARERFGTTELPLNSFNKVWILPESATVYEHENTVYVVGSRLKVLTDADYLAASGRERPAGGQMLATQSQIIKEIIIPELEREVNQGKHFAPLRQIYHSLILAKWYKETMKESLLSQVYVDQNKVDGVDDVDEGMKNRIYDRYIHAYKKGVFNYIKKDYDELAQKEIPRKYFSGGISDAAIETVHTDNAMMAIQNQPEHPYELELSMQPQGEAAGPADRAMLVKGLKTRMQAFQTRSREFHVTEQGFKRAVLLMTMLGLSKNKREDIHFLEVNALEWMKSPEPLRQVIGINLLRHLFLGGLRQPDRSYQKELQTILLESQSLAVRLAAHRFLDAMQISHDALSRLPDQERKNFKAYQTYVERWLDLDAPTYAGLEYDLKRRQRGADLMQAAAAIDAGINPGVIQEDGEGDQAMLGSWLPGLQRDLRLLSSPDDRVRLRAIQSVTEKIRKDPGKLDNYLPALNDLLNNGSSAVYREVRDSFETLLVNVNDITAGRIKVLRGDHAYPAYRNAGKYLVRIAEASDESQKNILIRQLLYSLRINENAFARQAIAQILADPVFLGKMVEEAEETLIVQLSEIFQKVYPDNYVERISAVRYYRYKLLSEALGFLREGKAFEAVLIGDQEDTVRKAGEKTLISGDRLPGRVILVEKPAGEETSDQAMLTALKNQIDLLDDSWGGINEMFRSMSGTTSLIPDELNTLLETYFLLNLSSGALDKVLRENLPYGLLMQYYGIPKEELDRLKVLMTDLKQMSLLLERVIRGQSFPKFDDALEATFDRMGETLQSFSRRLETISPFPEARKDGIPADQAMLVLSEQYQILEKNVPRLLEKLKSFEGGENFKGADLEVLYEGLGLFRAAQGAVRNLTEHKRLRRIGGWNKKRNSDFELWKNLLGYVAGLFEDATRGEQDFSFSPHGTLAFDIGVAVDKFQRELDDLRGSVKVKKDRSSPQDFSKVVRVPAWEESAPGVMLALSEQYRILQRNMPFIHDVLTSFRGRGTFDDLDRAPVYEALGLFLAAQGAVISLAEDERLQEAMGPGQEWEESLRFLSRRFANMAQIFEIALQGKPNSSFGEDGTFWVNALITMRDFNEVLQDLNHSYQSNKDGAGPRPPQGLKRKSGRKESADQAMMALNEQFRILEKNWPFVQEVVLRAGRGKVELSPEDVNGLRKAVGMIRASQGALYGVLFNKTVPSFFSENSSAGKDFSGSWIELIAWLSGLGDAVESALERGRMRLSDQDKEYLSSIDRAIKDFAGQLEKIEEARNGGIDLNNIAVEREGDGPQIRFSPIPQADLKNMVIDGVPMNEVTGFAPVIINLTPIPSILPLLGLAPRKEEDFELSAVK